MTTAEVRLWGQTVGAVSVAAPNAPATFEYAPEFLRSGLDVAPLAMPLERRVFEFPELVGATFRSLPGLLADSLPDRFGRLLIDVWLQQRNRSARSRTGISCSAVRSATKAHSASSAGSDCRWRTRKPCPAAWPSTSSPPIATITSRT